MRHRVVKFTKKFEITIPSLKDCGNDDLLFSENCLDENYSIKSETVDAQLELEKLQEDDVP